jgi:hypothetical protein
MSWRQLQISLVQRYWEEVDDTILLPQTADNDTLALRILAEIPETFLSQDDGFVRLNHEKLDGEKGVAIPSARFEEWAVAAIDDTLTSCGDSLHIEELQSMLARRCALDRSRPPLPASLEGHVSALMLAAIPEAYLSRKDAYVRSCRRKRSGEDDCNSVDTDEKESDSSSGVRISNRPRKRLRKLQLLRRLARKQIISEQDTASAVLFDPDKRIVPEPACEEDVSTGAEAARDVVESMMVESSSCVEASLSSQRESDGDTTSAMRQSRMQDHLGQKSRVEELSLLSTSTTHHREENGNETTSNPLIVHEVTLVPKFKNGKLQYLPVARSQTSLDSDPSLSNKCRIGGA